jgi:4-aminobutyrate aminotransferase
MASADVFGDRDSAMKESTSRPGPARTEGDVNLSPYRQRWAETHLDQQTAAQLEADARHFLHQSLSTPCLNVLDGCEGIYLVDAQGRRIMDFHGNNVHQVGFANRRVVEAVKRQLDTLAFCPRRYTNRPAIELAEKLTALAPGRLNKVLFAPGGTTAIGVALKLVRHATGRFKTVSMWDSFHGASLDAISIGGEALFRQGAGPLLPGTEHVPPPTPRNCPFGCGGDCTLKCADYIDYVLEKEGDVAAVIAEPIRSTTVVPPPPGYWQRVRQSCDRHGALLVLDEIPIGLGRTGKMFCCEHFDVEPDVLVIGKGLGGGVFPMAAVIAREDLNVAPDKALGHYTHEKSPLGAAAALATIACIEEEGLLQNAVTLGDYAMQGLRAMQKRHPLIADVRGLGLLLGIELVRDYRKATDEAEQVMYGCLSRGLSFKVSDGNVLSLSPPLTITEAQWDQALQILEETIREAG